MTKPTIQIGDQVREMTDAEHEQHLLDLAEWQAQAEAHADKVKARQVVITKLGLTADEVTALLG